MIAGQLSFLSFSLLATVTAVTEAKGCRARHSSKLMLGSTSVIASVPPKTLAGFPATTLATSIQPKVQPTQQANAGAIPQGSMKAPASGTASANVAAETPSSETFFGVGTRYGLSDGCTEEDCWQNGACSFVDYDLPSTLDGSTCVSDDIWNSGANCGGCISVTYKGKTLKIMVTNRTGGNATHLDMTPDTFSKLTNGYSGGGVNGIEWEWTPCPLPESSPLQVHMHGGSSRFWFAATIENATLRTKNVEVSSDMGATWLPATLNDPNMWKLDGTLPNDTCWVRVTSVNDDQVIVKDVALQSGKVTKATENF